MQAPTDFTVNFDQNTVKTHLSLPPISRGAKRSIPLRVVLSRKIFKKVTNRIFAAKTFKISPPLLHNPHLFPFGE
jgi:hypothetical protein